MANDQALLEHDRPYVRLPHVYELASYLVSRSRCRHLIEIGCGSSGIPQVLEGDVQITCLDAAIMRRTVEQIVPSARFIECDFEEGLPDLGGIEQGAVVVCANVIKRLKAPDALCRALAQLSRVAAYVLISAEDCSRTRGPMADHPPGNRAHETEWGADQLGRFLRECGFSSSAIVGHTVNNSHDLTKNTVLVIAGVEAEYRRPERVLSVAAIVSTFNEFDIIEGVLRHLQSEGVETHVFDNWSSDSTFEIVERLVREGVCKSVERYPEKPSFQYEWSNMLQHHAAYGSQLEADWILHHDADEIRVAPWAQVKLREAISFVDSLGYSAIEFTVVNFAFTDESSDGTFDPASLKFFDFGRQPPDFQQVKGWRNLGQAVDLASSGGHSCLFENRKIYPLKFLNKHYPLRSIEQANRKVFKDRLPRVAKEHKELGWHTHYDGYSKIAGIKPWRKFELLNFDQSLFSSDYLIERLSGIGIEIETRPIVNLETRLVQTELDHHRITFLEGALEERNQRVAQMKASASWRITSPFREMFRLLRRLRVSAIGAKFIEALRQTENFTGRKRYRFTHTKEAETRRR